MQLIQKFPAPSNHRRDYVSVYIFDAFALKVVQNAKGTSDSFKRMQEVVNFVQKTELPFFAQAYWLKEVEHGYAYKMEKMYPLSDL